MHRPFAAALLALAAATAMTACASVGPGPSGAGTTAMTPGPNWQEEYKAAGIAQGHTLEIPCDDFASQGATTVEAIYHLSVTSLYPDGIPSDATASSIEGLAPAVEAGVVPADAPVSTILQLQSEVAHEVCGF